MKKNIILLGALIISGVAYSQVGINTESPKATLHVLGSPTDTSKLDGISIVNLLVWTEFHKCRRDFA